MLGSSPTRRQWSRRILGFFWALLVLPVPSCDPPATPGDWVNGLPDADALQAVWVLRTKDCFSCQSLDFLIRRAQQKSSGRLPVTVIHVGWEADSLVPRSLLHHARIAAEVVHLSPKSYQGYWAGREPPHLYLVHNGRVVWDLEEAAPNRSDSAFLLAVSERLGEVNPDE